MSKELKNELRSAVQILKLYEPIIDERLPKAKSGDRRSALNLITIAGGLMRAGYPLQIKLGRVDVFKFGGFGHWHEPREIIWL